MSPEPPLFDQPDPEPTTSLLETVNVGDEAGVKAQTKAQAIKQRDSAEFWQMILATEEGRREIWQILDDAGTFAKRAGISANGGYDPIVNAFYDGQRLLGHRIYARLLAYDREGVVQMLIEHDITIRNATPAAAPRRRPRKNPDAPIK